MALAWIDQVGASFAHISRDGTLVATSGRLATGQGSLRRAQASANDEVARALTRLVLDEKLRGQVEILSDFPDQLAAIRAVEAARTELNDVDSPRSAMRLEAKAAIAYWGAVEQVEVHWVTADAGKVPAHWRSVGPRTSTLSSSSPRAATSVAHAIWNYCYALGEFASSVALRAAGLDPELGWLHTDTPYRASAALDIEEAMRPVIDRFVLDMLSERRFSRREFGERPNGQVRLSSELAKDLGLTLLPQLQANATLVGATVVELLGSIDGVKGRRRTLPTAPRKRLRPPPNRLCLRCGTELSGNSRRKVCDECLPAYQREKGEQLRDAGRSALARVRESEDQDAVAARERRNEAIRRRMLEQREWERVHGKPDWSRYDAEVVPLIMATTPAGLARRTGLSTHHCWQVQKQLKRLHPMHWQKLMADQGR